MFATSAQRWLYQHVAKPIFFRMDPEYVHDRVLHVGKALGRTAPTRRLTHALCHFAHPALHQTILGIDFPNPVGLTAGFDKNAELTRILPSVGFGFAEIGSVTGEPCEGNPKPRLWRLPKSQALVVWYGLKNDGSTIVAKRLQHAPHLFPIGTSIARTNSPITVPTAAGIADYRKAFHAFAEIGDYTAVNISCPNTCGGEPFNEPTRLEMLLTALDEIPTKKPTFIKLSADISPTELDALVAVCDKHRVHGFILSNLTKNYDRSSIDAQERHQVVKGGVSGRPIFDPSNALIAHLYTRVGSRYVIVGSGGVFTADDAFTKIRLGASLVQLATGMIFQGPQLIGEINRGLVDLVHQNGMTSISEAIGTAHTAT